MKSVRGDRRKVAAEAKFMWGGGLDTPWLGGICAFLLLLHVWKQKSDQSSANWEKLVFRHRNHLVKGKEGVESEEGRRGGVSPGWKYLQSSHACNNSKQTVCFEKMSYSAATRVIASFWVIDFIAKNTNGSNSDLRLDSKLLFSWLSSVF